MGVILQADAETVQMILSQCAAIAFVVCGATVVVRLLRWAVRFAFLGVVLASAAALAPRFLT